MRYELAVSLTSGWFVWASRPYTYGLFPELKILNGELRGKRRIEDLVLFDWGYRGDQVKHEISGLTDLSPKIMAHQETVNRMLKQFNILVNTFRNGLYLHSYCVHAVANLSQLMLKTSNPLSIFSF